MSLIDILSQIAVKSYVSGLKSLFSFTFLRLFTTEHIVRLCSTSAPRSFLLALK